MLLFHSLRFLLPLANISLLYWYLYIIMLYSPCVRFLVDFIVLFPSCICPSSLFILSSTYYLTFSFCIFIPFFVFSFMVFFLFFTLFLVLIFLFFFLCLLPSS
jgi:hypothetical protein